MRILLLTFIFSIGLLTLLSQHLNPYFASYFDVSSGLSNNYVTNIIEDDFGFKWITTEEGLNRFDGTIT